MTLLDPHQPHDDETSRAQVNALLRRVRGQRCCVLDLGCGTGRTLLPLARAGHRVIGVDCDRDALDRCALTAEQLGLDCTRHVTSARKNTISNAPAPVTLLHADLHDTDTWSSVVPACDMVCILGNTFLTITDIDRGVDLLRRAAACLTPTGVIALDNFVAEIWTEVAEGNWQQGISDDGSMQMIWPAGDTIVAFRTGDAVDPESWSITDRDTPLRLWTYGELHLAARCAGLSAPIVDAGAHLIELRPATTA